MAGARATMAYRALGSPMTERQYQGAARVMSAIPPTPTPKNRGMAARRTRRTSFHRPRVALSDTSRDTATGNPAVARLNTGP